MVVLSAAIIAKGKTLIARQFVEMTRLRVEGLLSAFPKLVEGGRDHTFVETETVRYVYQPMEQLHVLLITNKASNIIEDLETLRLLAKVIQDCCSPVPVGEEPILKNAFDIVFAFDEVISFGHRESVTLAQIKTYTEMDSHEEKLHQMIEKAKMNEAAEMAKRRQKELSAQRKAGEGPSMPGIGGGSMSMPGIEGGSPSGNTGSNTGSSLPDVVPNIAAKVAAAAPAPWTGGMSMDDSATVTVKAGAPKKGMMLGKKKAGDQMAAAFGIPAAAETVAETFVEAAPAPAVVNPLTDPVKVDIEEKVTANLQVEGGLQGEAECQGQFQVTVLNAEKAGLVSFRLNPQDQEFKYKVHPNLNKQSHANNVLEVRDVAKAFKAGVPIPLVKWRGTSTKEDFLPVSLSCWPSSTADGTEMVLQLELTDKSVTLEDVHIRFPAPGNCGANITSKEPENSEARFDGQCVHWHIPTLDANEDSGMLEFTARADQASLLPATFEAIRRGQTKCPMEILETYHMESKESIGFALEKSSQYSLTIGA